MRVLPLAGFLLMMWGLQTASAQQTPAAPAAGTQAAATTAPAPIDLPLPADPVQRLELASKVNGLEVPDIHPWHLKASFQIQDMTGKPLDNGTFEEWWAGPKRYKVIYHGQDFSQTEYGTEKGIFREGSPQIPPFMLGTLRNTIGGPMGLPGDAKHLYEVKNFKRRAGPLQLQCISVRGKEQKRQGQLPDSYCFESPKAALRYTSSYGEVEQIVFDKQSIFNGRFVAREFVLLFVGQPVLSVHINAIEPIETTDAAFATVPVAAVLATGPEAVWSHESGGRVVKRVFPVYPPYARQHGITGAVLLTATITTDGSLRNIQVWGGPEPFRTAAVDAVSQWRYSPPLSGGKPVEVETVINIMFTLG
jgi:TonB family protein